MCALFLSHVKTGQHAKTPVQMSTAAHAQQGTRGQHVEQVGDYYIF